MNKDEVLNFLRNRLYFSNSSIKKLALFEENLLKYNKKYNLISKNSENILWHRHILDSAQIVKYIGTETRDIADFGSGAGFPGVILSIFDINNKFHVKLYEKSPIKRRFLEEVAIKLNLNIAILGNINDEKVYADLIVARAFKKLNDVIKISRENKKKTYKILILKGKNANDELKTISLNKNYSYKIKDSLTDNESKILIFQVN